MTLIPSSRIRDVRDILEVQRIYDFLQGAIYCWCKNRPDEWFAIRDLLGGENFEWEGTPLYQLYEKQRDNGKLPVDAVSGAGIEAGWMAKRVIHNDRRNFETRNDGWAREYKWVK